MLFRSRREAKRALLYGTVILVLISIFTKSQASSPFEAVNSAHLSMCQKDVRPFLLGVLKKNVTNEPICIEARRSNQVQLYAILMHTRLPRDCLFSLASGCRT